MGSDLLKFEATVTIQKSGDFSFKTPKVRLLVLGLEGGYYLYDWSLLRVSPALCLVVSEHLYLCPRAFSRSGYVCLKSTDFCLPVRLH